MNHIQVSVIIPCSNEKEFITPLLDSILAMDYPKSNLEILVVDGMSDDGTRDVIKDYATKYPFINLVNNEAKIVPYALNKAISIAKGDIIIRIDAHSTYPSNYISKLVEVLNITGGDNVGACLETIPGDSSLKAKAIAIATSHPFGVGNSTFRLKNDTEEPFEVDTVPFGCYRKSIFSKIGMFDEDLIRNQDNELNERLLKAGGKIFLIPDLKVRYFARKSFTNLWNMFYQYAYFGPLVDLKLGRPPRLRRYIPCFFVLSLVLPLLISVLNKKISKISLLIGGIHALVNSVVSISIAIKNMDLKLVPYLFVSFLTSHVSYGVGYIAGYYDFKIMKKRSSSSIKLSR